MIQDGDIDAQMQAALNESVFDDYGTMVLMRGIGSVVVAILLLLFVFYPLYTLLWRYLRDRFPAIGENFYLKRHKANVQDDKDYVAYINWTERNGYEPVIDKRNTKRKK